VRYIRQLQEQPYERKERCCSQLLFFEPLIFERRLTLDLYHSIAFANTSKPLRPRVFLIIIQFAKFVGMRASDRIFKSIEAVEEQEEQQINTIVGARFAAMPQAIWHSPFLGMPHPNEKCYYISRSICHVNPERLKRSGQIKSNKESLFVLSKSLITYSIFSQEIPCFNAADNSIHS
jgi:hypothetical protein